MMQLRVEGLTSLYLDETLSDYSSIAVGHIIRAVGHGLKVAYVDSSKTGSRLINFLENLCLSHSFVKAFDRLHIETLTFRGKGKIAKGIIPSVEFYTIDEKMFWKTLGGYDLVIFDNMDTDAISFFSLTNFLRSKPTETEVVAFVKDKKRYDEMKEEFNYAFILEQKAAPTLMKNRNIVSITGPGKGKSLLSFGHLIRGFIQKNDVKLVYFDKGDMLYGEMLFFTALKKWKKNHTNYGTFDFVATGLPRFEKGGRREQNTPGDIKEAQEALMLLKTALKKKTPVVADELTEAIENNLLTIEEVVSVLEQVTNELFITGENTPAQIRALSNSIVTLEIDKEPKKKKGLKKGVDF